jgi:type IV pilus assembly protein PilW
MKKFNFAYSLLELLIVIFISALVSTAIYLTFISLFKGYKVQTRSGEKILEEVIALEVIRSDIANAGIGMPIDNASFVHSFSGSNDNITLTINSTLVKGADNTSGFVVLKFDNNTNEWSKIYDKRDITTSGLPVKILTTDRVFITAGQLNGNTISHNSGVDNGTIGIGYPLINLSPPYYTSTVYKIGGTHLNRCSPIAFNLLRNNEPIIDCVKGFKVYYGVDSDNDTEVDKYCNDLTCAELNSSVKQYNNLKLINMFILTHEGGRDKNFTFNTNAISFDDDEIGTVTFNLSGDYQNYRWKILRVSTKTYNVRGITYEQ